MTDSKTSPSPRRGGILLVTDEVPSDPTLAWVIQAATRIPLSTITWTAASAPQQFEAELQAALALADLAIVDLGALRERGVGLCAQVVAHRQGREPPAPKLIGLGPTEDSPYEDAAFRAGCDGFVGTPVDRVQLLEQLRRLETWRLRGAHRAPLQVPLTWTHPDGKRRRGQTRDLSEGGLQFDSEQPIPAAQNVPIELKLRQGQPAVFAWIRVVRSHPSADPHGELTASVAAEFLNLSAQGRAEVAAAIAHYRHQEFLARLDQDAETEATILTDPTVALVADWLHFLVTPVAFGNPPPTLDIDVKHLRAAVGRLAPHEEVLFSRVATEALTPAQYWQRVWAAFRAWLSCAVASEPPGSSNDNQAQIEFVARARQLLELLAASLTAWKLTDIESSDTAKEEERRSVLLALREGINLRALYDERRGEEDPELLAGIAEAEDYFAEGGAAGAPATFLRGVFRRAKLARRAAKPEGQPRSRPRRRVVVWGALLTLLAGSYLATNLTRDQNVLVPAHELKGKFPILSEVSLSRGEDPTVLVGDLSPTQWNAMSVSERNQLARELLLFLNGNQIRGAVLSCSKRLAIQIDGGQVVFVQ